MYQIWDGFDDYDGAHDRWDTVQGTPTYSTGYARFAAAPNCAGKGIRFPGNSWKQKNLNSNQAQLVFSFPFCPEALPTSGWGAFLQLLDTGSAQCQFGLGADGSLALLPTTSSTSPLVRSAPGLISVLGYYWIDIVISINNSAGAVSLYLSTVAGGSALFTGSGLNTRGTSNNYANQIRIGDVGNKIAGIRFDDFHCHDTSGSAPNAVLGEGTRIYTKLPNAAGYATTLTPNGASANWQCVDDNPPDDDTTYVNAASYPLTEGYAIGAAGFAGAVNGVVRTSRIRKNDAGAHTFQNGVRSGSTNALAAAVVVPSVYGYTDSFSATDPNTSAAWLAAGADAAQPVICAAS